MKPKVHFYIVSVLIHLLMLTLFIDYKSESNIDKNRKKIRSIILKKDIAKNRSEENKEKKKEDDVLKKDVVDIAKPINPIKPDDPKYLAKYDSKVKKQTKVEKTNPQKNELSETHPQKVSLKNKVNLKDEKTPSQNGALTNSEKIADNKKMDEIKKKMDELGVKEIVSKKENKENMKNINDNIKNIDNSSQVKNFDSSNNNLVNNPLRFSDLEFSKMIKGSNDFLKDVEDGDITSLDTLAYEYSDYFLKMKSQLSKEWNPSRIYQIHDPYRKIYGVKDRYTILKVTINKDGNLDHLSIRQSSGLPFLDKEAMRAFEKAQPFKVVPQPLVAKTGNFTILFGFYVDNPDSPQIFYINR